MPPFERRDVANKNNGTLPNGNGVMEDEEFSEEVTSSKHASEVCT
jgi:hypothetical protein